MSNYKRLIFAMFALIGLSSLTMASAEKQPAYKAGEYGLTEDQFAEFPLPLGYYDEKLKEDGILSEGETLSLSETLSYRAKQQNGFNLVATIIFVCAILHTFLAGFFVKMAHDHQEKHEIRIKKEGRTGCAKPQEDAKDDVSFKAQALHFLGEVEVIFGLWIAALAIAIYYFFGFLGNGLDGFIAGYHQIQLYFGSDVNFIEPVFVVIIMAIAATRPVVRFAERVIGSIARIFGGGPAAWWLSIITVAPILGSFITEPAAMTIAAMLLAKRFFDKNPPANFAYATLGLLFVNISVGGTLTHFAAPPVLMVASKWNFGMDYMFINFGLKAVVGIAIANTMYFFIYRKHFKALAADNGQEERRALWAEREDPIPLSVTLIHLAFLAWTVLNAHDPPLFILGFMFFLGFTQTTGHHQNDVSMKSPLLVGFFLAGLVIHGKCQSWWIAPLITSIDNNYFLMIGSIVLTAFNDNAAITYLASQAPGLSIGAKYAVLAGAVTGGGLTVIANAPNPAGQSILGKYFKGGVVPFKLLKAALIPTFIMGACFMLIPSKGMVVDPLDDMEHHGEHAEEHTDAGKDSQHDDDHSGHSH
ncbi:MAG: putative Na+/H+ antiporter [Rubritalea sp.]|uniref:putative Na+/H+ antiporter n=1 Tax=Rubritalea sp. TaxID=2109375 RepID=UPI00324237B5